MMTISVFSNTEIILAGGGGQGLVEKYNVYTGTFIFLNCWSVDHAAILRIFQSFSFV
jgi:hypothetical protein